MYDSCILFSAITSEFERIKKHLDIDVLSYSELLHEVVVGRFVILEPPPQRRYIFIPKADPLGFVTNLKLRLSDAKATKVAQRLTSQDQLYDIEIRCERDRVCLRDCAQQEEPHISIDLDRFMNSIDQCAYEVYNTMEMLLSKFASRSDADQLRTAMGVSARSIKRRR